MLDRDIQDNAGNVTRFLVLAREPLITVANDPRPHKTSVVFAFAEGPGQLVNALSVFALRGLALYKVRCCASRLRCLLCRCVSLPLYSQKFADNTYRIFIVLDIVQEMRYGVALASLSGNALKSKVATSLGDQNCSLTQTFSYLLCPNCLRWRCRWSRGP